MKNLNTINQRNTLIVVDPFSSGAVFAQRAKTLYGYDSVAIITNTQLPHSVMASFQPDDYLKVYYVESLEQTIAEVELDFCGKPLWMICGSEPGVLVFDALTHHWQLAPNDIHTTHARRDKYLMQDTLKKAGLAYIPFFKSGELTVISDWCETHSFATYVVKPINSFGTDGVFFCDNSSAVLRAASKLIGTNDYAGNINTEVLIEEKIIGDEYVVDAVSCQGQHFIVNMFRYTKTEINGSPIYRQMATVNIADHLNIAEYAKHVLTALGIKNGASHNEIILSPQGPVLVESGARMHGGLGPTLVEKCNSHSLINLALMARVSPPDFAEQTKTEAHLQQYAIEYFMVAPEQGKLLSNRVAETAGQLISFSHSNCALKAGDFVAKTVDLVTSCGRIVLIHIDRNQLLADTTTLQTLENKGQLLTTEEVN